MYRKTWIAIFLVFCIGLTSCFEDSEFPRQVKTHLSGQRPAVWSNIDKVVVVVLENTDFEKAVVQPFMKDLIQKGALLTKYYALTHPSQPNYIAMVSGQTHGVMDDDNVTVKARHIGDILEEKGKTWKAYAEGFPGNCFLKAHKGAYYRKHVPFLSFESVQTNSDRCAKIVDGDFFRADLSKQSLPNFSFYVPDINNDGHDTGIAFADRWLSKFFAPIFDKPKNLEDTLYVVTFDEGTNGKDNRIVTVLVGAGVKVGAVSNQDYDHYSLLRTIEEIFKLSTLGASDQTASAIDDVWLDPPQKLAN